MTGAASARAAEIVRDAHAVYAGDEQAESNLRDLDRRLREPLRVAVAGMIKAGKSTLLNAIIGQEVAFTGTGEATRMVTWYRFADTPAVMIHLKDGRSRSLPIDVTDGVLSFDVGAELADTVDRLEVRWPAEVLRDMTLIDTPGLGSLAPGSSARSTDFLTPDDASSQADAVIYVLRHVHVTDLSFLQAFRHVTASHAGTVNALTVLSRADEIGAGRLNSLISAAGIVDRYRHDEALRELALGVVPMAGLLAQAARTLGDEEFATLSALAALGKERRDRLMLSVDRFARADEVDTVDAAARSGLLERLGIFGIRLSIVLIRGGVADREALAEELVRRSGLDELLAVVAEQFEMRADYLKARTAVTAVEALLRDRPRDAERLVASIERFSASAHDFTELRLLATLRNVGLAMPPGLTAEVEQLIGAEGLAARERLGLDDDAPENEVRTRAMHYLDRWRTLSENPLIDRATADVCAVVIRSCEAILADLEPVAQTPDRLLLVSEPGSRAGQEAGDQSGSR